MNKFINRKAQDLNKKILEVEEIERGSDGEITKIVGTLVRADNPETEGTALNAENMNSIIKKMVNELIKDALLTDEERVNIDIDSLKIEEYVDDNFTVPLVGDKGSKITWTVENGNAEINNYNDEAVLVKVDKELIETDIKLKATFTSGQYSQSHEYNITLSAREMTDEEKVIADTNLLDITTEVVNELVLPTIGENGTTITWAISEGTGVTINNNIATLDSSSVDTYVILLATISLNGYSDTKYFEVLFKHLPSFLPKTYGNDWIQSQGNLNESTFNISCTEEIYVEVKNYDIYALDVEVLNNETGLVRVKISETLDLNNSYDIVPTTFTFEVDVYLNNNRNTLLGTLTGKIDYYFTSTAPLD